LNISICNAINGARSGLKILIFNTAGLQIQPNGTGGLPIRTGGLPILTGGLPIRTGRLPSGTARLLIDLLAVFQKRRKTEKQMFAEFINIA